MGWVLRLPVDWPGGVTGRWGIVWARLSCARSAEDPAVPLQQRAALRGVHPGRPGAGLGHAVVAVRLGADAPGAGPGRYPAVLGGLHSGERKNTAACGPHYRTVAG